MRHQILHPTEYKGGICVDPSGEILWDVSDYLINLGNTCDADDKTVRQKGGQLAAFLDYCSEYKMSLYSVTNHDLEKFRDWLRKNHSVGTVRLYLQSVCHFYYFAQKNGYVAHMIGCQDMLKGGPKPLIQVEPDYRRNINPRFPFKIPFLPNSTQKSGGRTYNKRVPHDYEYDDILHSIAHRHDINTRTDEESADSLNTRNLLVARWLGEAGLRLNEVVSITVEDILGSVQRKNKKELVEITLHRGVKNNKPRKILVSPELIAETQDYVDIERDTLISGQSDLGALFVAKGKNGGPLSKSAVQGLIREASNGSVMPHNLRRYHLTTFAIALYKLARVKAGEKGRVGEELIKMYLLQQAGHKSFDTTLKYYLDVARRHGSSEPEQLRVEQERKLSQAQKRNIYSGLLEIQA